MSLLSSARLQAGTCLIEGAHLKVGATKSDVRYRTYWGRATCTGKVAVAGLIRRSTSLVQSFSVISVRNPFSKSQTAQNK